MCTTILQLVKSATKIAYDGPYKTIFKIIFKIICLLANTTKHPLGICMYTYIHAAAYRIHTVWAAGLTVQQ